MASPHSSYHYGANAAASPSPPQQQQPHAEEGPHGTAAASFSFGGAPPPHRSHAASQPQHAPRFFGANSASPPSRRYSQAVGPNGSGAASQEYTANQSHHQHLQQGRGASPSVSPSLPSSLGPGYSMPRPSVAAAPSHSSMSPPFINQRGGPPPPMAGGEEGDGEGCDDYSPVPPHNGGGGQSAGFGAADGGASEGVGVGGHGLPSDAASAWHTQRTYPAPFAAASLERAVDDCLALYLYADAIAVAERLHEAFPSGRSLHTLAAAYLRSGDHGTAYRLLQHHFPFAALPTGEDSSASSSAAVHYRLVYLLGVACGMGGRYGECLAQMRSIPLPSLEPSAHSFYTAAAMATADGVGVGGGCGLLPPPALPSPDRLSAAAVLYWIGVCEARQGGGGAPGYWAAAVRFNPTLLHTAEACVEHGGLEGGGSAAVDATEAPLVPPQAHRILPTSSSSFATDGGIPLRPSALDLTLPPLASAKRIPLAKKKKQNGGPKIGGSGRGEADTEGNAHPYPNVSSLVEMDAARAFLAPIAGVNAALQTFNCAEAYAAVSGPKGLALVRPSAFYHGATCTTVSPSSASSFSVPLTADALAALPTPPEAGDGAAMGAPKYAYTYATAGSSSTSAASPSPSYYCATVKALCCFHSGDNANAAVHFAEALRIAPWRLGGQHWVSYSTALWHLQDARALGVLSQTLLTELGPSAVACCVAANYYSRLQNKQSRKAAGQLLGRAVSLDPSLSAAHALLGYEGLAASVGDGHAAAAACEAFHAALRANPRHYMAIAGLGEAELQRGNVEAAREAFYKSLAVNPLPSVMMRYAATFHRRDSGTEELAAAIQLYDEVLGRLPRAPTARLRKAAALLQLGDAESALEEAEALRRQDGPEEAEVYMLKARCLAALGDAEGATAAATRAVGLDTRTASDAERLLNELRELSQS